MSFFTIHQAMLSIGNEDFMTNLNKTKYQKLMTIFLSSTSQIKFCGYSSKSASVLLWNMNIFIVNGEITILLPLTEIISKEESKHLPNSR